MKIKTQREPQYFVALVIQETHYSIYKVPFMQKARTKSKLLKCFHALICTILLVAFSLDVYSQDELGDELNTLWLTWNDADEEPNSKASALNRLINDYYLFDQPDSAYILCKLLLEYSIKNELQEWEGASLQAMGGSYYVTGDYDSAIFYFERSSEVFEKIGIKIGVASNYGNIANILTTRGDYINGISYYAKALKIHESIGSKRGAGIQQMNIGTVYKEMGDNDEAMVNFLAALTILEEIDHKGGIADCMTNIASIHSSREEYDSAEKYYQQALDIYELLKDRHGIAYSLRGLSGIRIVKGNVEEAFSLSMRALEIQRELGVGFDLANGLFSVGRVYLTKGLYSEALKYIEESFTVSKDVDYLHGIARASGSLHTIYKALGDITRALESLEMNRLMNDSIQKESNHRALYRHEFKSVYEKQAMADSLNFSAERKIQLKEIQRQRSLRNMGLLGFLVVSVFGGIVLLQRNRIAKEKARSELLLLNILPEEVAEELKEKGAAKAKLFDEVTVLFTDFKGFTELASILPADILVSLLNECFSAFDRITETHGLEKIKTIGDAYMAAGGLPTPNTTHARDVVIAAIEMRDFITRRFSENASSETHRAPTLEIRIGIHTGPVVAGIVGIKKFQYDIWGDTVNTASRMESSGAPGKVNVSESTYEIIKNEFAFEERGQIEAKGKGKLGMWFVEMK